jgi:hypothetical protein
MANDLAYNLDAIRSKMRKKKGGGSRDPNEWRCEKADDGKKVQHKFFILPPTDTMDLWYYEHGNHFIDNKVIQCPRIHDGDECPLCQYGFDLMKETTDKDERRSIAKNYLASSRFSVNIYFPDISSTPAELRDKIMWYSMPQSVFAILEEVIMRDPPNDDDIEPEPYGIFFDPNKALPFLLEARKKGDFNSYESSHFINKAMPISKDIEGVLARRHDIPSVFDDRDFDALQTIVDNLTGNTRRSSPKPSSKPAAKKEEEKEDKASEALDELDGFDELSESKEEEEKPKKSAKSESKAEAKKEAEDEDASVDEEDEDLTALLEELNG